MPEQLRTALEYGAHRGGGDHEMPSATPVAAHDTAPALTASARGVDRIGDPRGQDPVVACAGVSPCLRAQNPRNNSNAQTEAASLVIETYGGNNTSGPIKVATACNAHGGSGRMDFESETFVVHGSQDPCVSRNAAFALGRNSGQENVCVIGGAAQAPTPGEGDEPEEDAGHGTSVAAHTNGAASWQHGAGTLRGKANDSHEHLVIAPHPPIAFSCKDNGGDAIIDGAPTLRAMGHVRSHPNVGGQIAISIQERAVAENSTAGPQGKRYRTDGQDHTLESRSVPRAMPPRGLRFIVRRLTPRECERLQGMPDGWTLIPTPRRNFRLDETGMLAYLAAQAGLDPKDDPDEITRLAADGPRYKAIGNSMAVPVMRWIGERLHHSSASTPGGGVAA